MRNLALLLTLAMFASGCATIMKTDEERLIIQTTPAGAKVKIGNTSCSTPCTLDLVRGQDYKATIEKSGYKTLSYDINGDSWDGWLWGNMVFLVGFPVGMAIDFSKGYAYDFSPSEIKVDLAPTGNTKTTATK